MKHLAKQLLGTVHSMTHDIEMAREMAAQCWCDDETKHLVMEPALAEAVARRIDSWMEIAAEYARNAEFYHGLLMDCGRLLWPDTYIQDDGGVVDEPLALKIPEVLARRIGEWQS